MRLICPNCGAQYEVPVEVIPENGRDVQCSNCGHTWFQRHPDDDSALAEELKQPVPDAGWEPEDDDDDEDWIEPPAPPPAARSGPGSGPGPNQRPAARRDTLAEEEAAAQRGLDPSVAEVLREEAALEARRRAAEAGGLENQPDLGLEEPDEDEQARRSRQARERMARLRGEDPQAAQVAPKRQGRPVGDAGRAAAEAAASAAAGSRRELLPDVEEINQTLRASSEPRVVDSAEGREVPAEPDTSAQGGGFGRGFLLVLLLAGAAIGVYAYAPQIGAQVPPAAPYLDAYVAQVDKGRAWLDDQVAALLLTLDGMSSESAPADNPDNTQDTGTGG